MKYTRITVVLLFCFAVLFMLPAQTEGLQTKVIDGKEFYIYKVKPSEGFYSLTHKFGISQEEIIRFNPAAKNGLKRGQLLMIPTKKTIEGEASGSEIESTFEHTIVRGESLYSISKMYKVTIQSIIDLNPGSEHGIKAGATLKIPQHYRQKKAKQTQAKATTTTTTPKTTTAQSKPVVPPVTDKVNQEAPSVATDGISGEYVYHTINAGETLFSISQKYDIDIETILKLNPGISPNNLKRGSVIRLTPNTKEMNVTIAPQQLYTEYKVRKKETLYSISKKFGTTVEEIKKCNPNIKKIKQDDIIYIPAGIEYNTVTAENPITSAEINNIYNKLYKSDKKGVINVAVILPFMLKQAHPDTKASLYTEYYQGFLMAVDSLKRQGASINVYAYDSEASDATVRNILTDPQLKEMDMIIAPDDDNQIKLIADFGLANDINVINTFSLKNEEVSHNAKIFQTNIPHSYLYAEAADRFIRYLGNRKVVFLTHTSEESDKKDFVNGLKEELSRAHIAYSEIKFGNELNLQNQDSIWAGQSGVVFVPTSARKKILSIIIAPLEALKAQREDLDIALFGYPEWLTQVPEYLNEFYKLNTYLYSRFYANPFDENAKSFHKRFLYWYNKDMINASPQYALLGFDTGIYFLSAIRAYGKNFAVQKLENSSDRIQTDFAFQRINNWSGFINKSFYFVNFAPDFTIKKIRE
ncbi:LysM peptidoglycan-binding domain-containing protein [Barnesiella viscericola]|uniref:LysM peptidoglycan-binding domain-containing protein n=1 Tax=Barnesiella viscericola TaxID=397865 RepID=UPI00255B6516|nr:LysM peptidoglycan-binding domain-containing protein [Barnesiella viscericola]